MKTIPPACPEPEVGRKYWRSIDQLAETPEFKQWLEREFPEGASEWTDPVSRRHFVKIMSASLMLAGAGLAGSGCRRPEEKIMPFSKMPENYIHGVAQMYATAMPTRGGAIPLVARSNDGRPTKVEGNDNHPDSNGGTDRFAQASILNLYDPDRAMRFMKGNSIASPATVMDYLANLSEDAKKNGGQGLSFLAERNTSPSRSRLQKQIAEKLPKSNWYTYEPIDHDIQRRSATAAFGKSVRPYYKYDAAKVIVSLDCDFIGSEEDAHNNIRRFAQGRRMENPKDIPNRLYSVESLMTLTGVNADHRLRIPASAVAAVAAGLASAIIKDGKIADLGQLPAGVDPKWIAECAADLGLHKGRSLVVAGYRQPMAVHILAHVLNSALGNIGKTVLLHAVPEAKDGTLSDLANALEHGQVETLVMLGTNPVYNAPADLNWAALQKKARTVLRVGYYEDETFAICNLHIPAAHYLESWGDALTSDGTLVAIQPLIAPLFGGITEIEVLARILGAKTTSPYEIVRETFAAISGSSDIEEPWKKFLHNGFLPNSATKPVDAKADLSALANLKAPTGGTPSKDNLEVVFHRDYSVDDGRYNNNGWLQEMPDPITKMVWDNAVLISRKTAKELNVKNGDVVNIQLGTRSITGPIWTQPGLADYSLGLPLGYGRKQSGRVGNSVGYDAYPLRTTAAESIAVGAQLKATGSTYTMACTQDHWSMEGRPIIREANLKQYEAHPKFAQSMHEEEPRSGAQSLYPNPFETLKREGHHQWGMSIDLNTCVGCSACMMACQSENNVPIVGKDQVRRGREMHWLRIDRYYSGVPEQRKRFDTFNKEEEQQFESWVDDPQVVTQPMMCQHCEAAPCENVCPVNATAHDQEGINVMVYNRCVGTRYCSNNCPYKVRKFNYFDYNKRGTGRNLYFGPLRHRPDDEWDLVKMIKNPEVTVRMRGVMEKCTFCIQRIESAKIKQKVKAGATADVIVPVDSFTTACAQACPAGAIVFGNIADPKSKVSKLKADDRNYSVLDFLNTKPRLTYLAKIRNPNPAMPDYKEAPLSLEYYKQKTDHKSYDEIFEGGEEHGAPAGEHATEKGSI